MQSSNEKIRSAILAEASSIHYLKELHRLQKQQVVYSNKIQTERERKGKLDAEFTQARREFNDRQSSTRNGFAVKEDDAEYRKIIARLETQLESSNVKLSTASKNNQDTKKKIDDLRKTKLMNLKISADLSEELNQSKRMISEANREITAINDRRYKIKNEIMSVRHQMVVDIEKFSKEVETAKNVIDSSQGEILDTIRERIQSTEMLMAASKSSMTAMRVSSMKEMREKIMSREITMHTIDSAALLSEVGVKTIDAFFEGLERSEGEVFELYETILEKEKLKDQLEKDAKELRAMINRHEERINQVKAYKESKRKELEEQVASIHESIAKYKEDYDRRQSSLQAVTDDLMMLLKNVHHYIPPEFMSL